MHVILFGLRAMVGAKKLFFLQLLSGEQTLAMDG
jgi:hypothetical protein